MDIVWWLFDATNSRGGDQSLLVREVLETFGSIGARWHATQSMGGPSAFSATYCSHCLPGRPSSAARTRTMLGQATDGLVIAASIWGGTAGA